MTPYYQENNITIYNADCRDVLPDLPKADLMLTDPPYGVALNTDNSRFTGGTSKRGHTIGSGKGQGIIGDDKPFDPSFLLRYSKDQIIWGWNNYPDKLPAGACLVWVKRNDAAFGQFLGDGETAWMSKRRGVYCQRYLSNTNGRVHPTQKPLKLMSWCLTFFPHAKNIIDPYMGSGTTLLAAKRQGIPAVGIEISEEYCHIAVERLRQDVLQFTEPLPEANLESVTLFS